MPMGKMFLASRAKPKAKAAVKAKDVQQDRKIRRLAKVVNRGLSHKFLNAISVSGALADAATNPNAALITAITGGSTDTTRVGDDVNLKELDMRFTYLGNINGANGHMRIVVFWDNQPVVGTPAAWNSVMQVGATAANAFLANKNQPNAGRFTVLFDKIVTKGTIICASSEGVAALGQGYIRLHKKWREGKVLKYTDATATNVIGSHLYYFAVSDATANIPVHRVEALIKFDD